MAETLRIARSELERLRRYAEFHDSQDALRLIDEILSRPAPRPQRIWNNWQVADVQ